jgi:hypothetical protein
MRALVFAALAALLVGCGTNPQSLRPAQTARSAVLGSPYSYQERFSMSGSTHIHTLAAGEYKARYQDDAGTFFEGPERCLEIRIIIDALTQRGEPQYRPRTYRCGIYVPNSVDALPKVYFYREENVYQKPPGLVLEAVESIELKNLHFYDRQPQDDSLKRALQIRSVGSR